MRILFAGSPGIAVPSLEALSAMELAGEGIALAGILTNADSPKGRSGKPEPTDVSVAASGLDTARAEKGFPPIAQLKFEKLDAAAREAVAALKPDLLISFAYGKIFGPKFLGLFPLGGINIHPSLLPKYRGATPIPAAILNREKETGVSIQKLALEMDAGDILAQEKFPLSGNETTASLSEDAAQRSAELLASLTREFAALPKEALSKSALFQGKSQEGEPSCCSLIRKEDGHIDWKLSALEIDARVRAFTPWPLCFTAQEGQTLYILEGQPFEGPGSGGQTETKAAPGIVLGIDRGKGILVQTGDGVYAVSRLQWQAKKALDWKSFMNGARDFVGTLLG
ncbi:methionyl-tRNA formyltransferase [Leadbettera azotonutricia]|uniref:Methionyl-tRNA formyltransferase n=1 Tax=Leadbettera azotonutricia (strain ATCC BAA-888 / DSM 13862 / ZAS-9) TaxID=545695 RepID=F5Y9W8_LEAAZ|nr:methionyl-tRNA formyltransferase [Leadbettera azotonutricia]AEF82388.1 methionyl-tRNA formyltransferase [Leadbettera azotonutricia ZAS-9]